MKRVSRTLIEDYMYETEEERDEHRENMLKCGYGVGSPEYIECSDGVRFFNRFYLINDQGGE